MTKREANRIKTATANLVRTLEAARVAADALDKVSDRSASLMWGWEDRMFADRVNTAAARGYDHAMEALSELAKVSM